MGKIESTHAYDPRTRTWYLWGSIHYRADGVNVWNWRCFKSTYRER